MQRAILFEEPASPRKLNHHLNRDIETIILKAIEKNGGRRGDPFATPSAEIALLDGLTCRHAGRGLLHRGASASRQNQDEDQRDQCDFCVFHFFTSIYFYSCRNATMGSSRAARVAG